MKALVNFGPITIYFFGLMIAIGVAVGIFILIREAKRHGMNHNLLMDAAIYSLIGGIIGARIVFVLVYKPVYYFSNPIEILLIHQGGLSIHGGILGGLLIGYLFLKRHQVPIWKTLDIAAPHLS